jgi:beta-N-acetylhexosaminidase
VSQSPSDQEIADAAAGAARRDLVIVGTHNGHLYPAQAELVKRVVQAGSPVVVVGMRNPYDLEDFAEVSTYIAAYSFRECSMQAAAEVIFGFTVPSGQLPVTIPGCK